MDKELGKAIPYGIYDVSANTGWVSVGTDHDTSAFAVADPTILVGHHRQGPLPATPTGCSICADGGGSNGYRIRAWKIELASFAAETGLHDHRLPPATGNQQMEPRSSTGCSPRSP